MPGSTIFHYFSCKKTNNLRPTMTNSKIEKKKFCFFYFNHVVRLIFHIFSHTIPLHKDFNTAVFRENGNYHIWLSLQLLKKCSVISYWIDNVEQLCNWNLFHSSSSFRDRISKFRISPLGRLQVVSLRSAYLFFF